MKINFIYSPDVSLEQMIGYEMSALIWGQLFTDEIELNILAKTTDQFNANVIGGATPEFHEQHYALFLQYFEADITSEEDRQAYEALQKGNTIDSLLNGELISGNTQLKMTTALAKALGMNEAISLDRYVLDESEHFLDGTIMMNQNFAWDFNYLRDSEAAENTLDFLSVALHETGHIMGFTSSLDFSLQQETLHSGRTELSNFSPLDLFRYSAESAALENPDGAVNDLSIGGVSWYSIDGGETVSAQMSTGKEGDGFQASHWERRYDPLGIMDPTLWYQERASITDLDLLAFDTMGYDLAAGASDVEQLFEQDGLESLLAQAKVQLADKLGVSVEWIENNAEIPESSQELITEMETAYVQGAGEGSAWEDVSTVDDSSGGGIDSLSSREQKKFFRDLQKMLKETYEWWAENGTGRGSSWQELYEWYAENGTGRGSSWQELYEWWAENSTGRGSSWQELYEWWAENGTGRGSSWQELYEWWVEDNTGRGSWWQEVFHNTRDGGDAENVKLPGRGRRDRTEVVYQEVHAGHDDDIIGGDESNDNIVAGKGDDLIDGAAGDDTIFGAGGFDTIFGFDGNDSIVGGMGDDVISGESGEDALFGESGADILMGGEEDDYLDGGEGRDFLNGNTGHDALMGGEGDDALEGEAGKDLLVGGEGQDIANGGSGDDYIFGDQYSDSLKQSFGNNISNLTSLFVPDADPDAAVSNNDPVYTMVLGQDPMLIEAENMTLSGDFKLNDKYDLASGGIIVENGSETTLETKFTGTAGLYDIEVTYHDVKNKDTTGEITANLSGREIGNWLLDKNPGDKNPNSATETTHTIENVSLGEGDIFSLEAIRSGKNDRGYIDSIKFVPSGYTTSESTTSQTTTSQNTNNLVLDPLRIEAENLNWSGTEKVENKDFASGGGYVFNDSKNSNITTSTPFTGETGLYNVVLGYYDSKKGQARVNVSLDGIELDNWTLDLQLDDSADNKTFVTRTLAHEINIEQGDVLDIEGIRYDDDDKVYLDFIEFVPYQPNAAIQVEAEYFNLSGKYALEQEDFASSGRLITTDETATLTTDFTGQAGLYDIIIGYHDVKGTGQIAASLEGAAIDNWSLTKDLGGDNPEISNFTFHMISDVSLQTGDTFSLRTIKDDKDKGYIDYVEFVPKTVAIDDTPEESTSEETPISSDDSSLEQNSEAFLNLNLGASSDILRGGAGNDGIDGGEGNDIIFGEDEFNDSSNIYAPLLDGALQHGYSSYILTTPGLTWHEAQAEAESYGGNLVTINDAAEEQWLKEAFGLERYWTGFSDSVSEGNWQWASKEAVTYTNWSPGQPDDSGSGQDFAYTNYGTSKLWDDSSPLLKIPGIIEIDWSSIGGNDTIIGGAGDDQVYGNTGNDIIYGDDMLSGKTLNTLSFQDGTDGYGGTVDNLIYSFDPDNDHKDLGFMNVDTDRNRDPDTKVDADFDDGEIRPVQSLIRFDDIFGSELNQIAPDQDIHSAFLELNVTNSGDSIEVYQLLQDWSGGHTTWNMWGNGIQANGFEASVIPVATTGSIDEGVLRIDVTQSLRSWQADPTSNEGWAFFPTGSDDVEFDSAEGDVTPRLVIDVLEDLEVDLANNSGNDNIFGNGGHDILNGGIGNDILNGTDETVAGYLERDVLSGDAGSDRFILGDNTQAYYATGGSQDYAVIKDFDSALDTIQLYGMADDYQAELQGNDVHLSYSGDLVAIFENNNALNLNAPSFEYVNAV